MITPYYADDLVILYHGDCRDVLPALPADSADLVLTDPPYGVNKAEWDNEWDHRWLRHVGRIAPILGLMPGVVNLPNCPNRVDQLRYRWTLAAHLVNGQTRGGIGYGNWIPCVVYAADDPAVWCSAFLDWCNGESISRDDLDRAAGTSDMGGWWATRLPHRALIPTPEQWGKLHMFRPPAHFERGVRAAARVYRKASDAQRIVVGREDKPAHPSPKPISVMRWLVDRLSFAGDLIIDPFAGSGTTLVAAREQGRRSIGVELDERYCEVIATRLAQDVLPIGAVA